MKRKKRPLQISIKFYEHKIILKATQFQADIKVKQNLKCTL